MVNEGVRTITDLTPDPANANRGTERGNAALEQSIQTLGLGRSVLADKNNVLIAGNKTWEQAARLGIERVRVVETQGDELVVVKRTDLDLATDPKARKLAISDNRVGQINLDFDPAVLDAQRQILGDLADIGLSDADLAEMKQQAAEAEDAAGGEPETPDDITLRDTHQVIVECPGEIEQKALYQGLAAQGHKPRLLTLTLLQESPANPSSIPASEPAAPATPGTTRRVDVTVSTPVRESFRVAQVAGMFDVPPATKATSRFCVEVPDVSEPWDIGLIVGPSGSGKSTIARKAFGDALIGAFDWPHNAAVVDGFPENLEARDIFHALAAVGFSSPPAWLRPYHVLSNGEKFRCDLARAILTDLPLVAIDEFTSVVDRTVAKVGSAAIAKAIRSGRIRRRFVAVTCHYDIAEWLQPDWVVDMATQQLARGRLQRPPLRIELHKSNTADWPRFKRHHYLDAHINRSARCYTAECDGQPVAFVAMLPLLGHKGHTRVSRIVVLPDYQGIGLGTRILDKVAALESGAGRIVSITSSHPSIITALHRSPHWRVRQFYPHGPTGAHSGMLQRDGQVVAAASGRLCVSFEYRGR